MSSRRKMTVPSTSSTSSAKSDAELIRKYNITEGTILLERIDQVLNIPNGVTSGIKINRKIAVRKLNGRSKSVSRRTLQKNRNANKPRHRKKLACSKAEGLENLTSEAMESLFTPETNLVEAPSISIWADSRGQKIPKKFYVARDQLPDQLKRIPTDHLWIEDPTCRQRKFKVQVIDSPLNSMLVTKPGEAMAAVPPLVPIGEQLPLPAINADMLEANTEVPEVQHASEFGSSATATLMKTAKNSQSPVPKQHAPQTLFRIGQNSDNIIKSSLLAQRLCGLYPDKNSCPDDAIREKSPIQETPTDNEMNANCFAVDHDHKYVAAIQPQRGTLPTQPVLLAVTDPLALPLTTTNPAENNSLAEARMRIIKLEQELLMSRKDLAAARVLIKRLELSDLAKSAQIRALKEMDFAQSYSLGEHFLAPILDAQNK